ncbi:MAG: RNA 2',3'-cyclic phosphodiesterase [Bacteroidota bacterium]
MPSLRLFIAIDTPSPIKTQISAIQSRLRHAGTDVKWESVDKFHITLKFLGNTTDHLLPACVTCTREIAERFPPLSVAYRNIGCFPDEREPKIVWAGVDDPSGNLERLHKAIDQAFQQLGFESEQRAFYPHVTIGRVKSQHNIRGLITTMESVTLESQPVQITEVALMKSELHSSGSVYTALQAFQLGG